MCQIADAYSLDEVKGSFNGAFAADWWSHISKKKIDVFLNALHSRLLPGSHVFFLDMLPGQEDEKESHQNDDGDLIHRRRLPNGKEFEVIKNFPLPSEIKAHLSGMATDIQYYVNHSLKRWSVCYITRER